MITKPIIARIKTRLSKLTNRRLLKTEAFTLLESLVVLAISSGFILLLSSQVGSTLAQVRNHLFFVEFEHFYRESQQLSQAKGKEVFLHFSQGRISNGYATLELPEDIEGPEGLLLTFDKSGGNHSLAKLDFQTDYKKVSYQLFLGSGQYKKSEN